MAGSYLHVTNAAGQLHSIEALNDRLENGGDVYEAVEEMYGMIWHLASQYADLAVEHDDSITAAQLVVEARLDYGAGIAASPGVAES